MSNDLHKRHLAKIHLLKKQLGLDEETYRGLLLAHGGHNSAKDMTAQEKVRVINWMSGYINGKSVAEEYADRASLFNAISSLKLKMGRYGQYANRIAGRMFGNSDLKRCTVIELGMVLAAMREQHQRESVA